MIPSWWMWICIVNNFSNGEPSNAASTGGRPAAPTMFKHFNLNLENKIAHLEINRPDKANSLHSELWQEFKQAFEWAHENPEVRVVVLSGAGKYFCAGIDLNMFPQMLGDLASMKDEGRKRERMRQIILDLQGSFNAIENCRKPVLAAIHSGCIGAGLDMISACDMRYCSQDAFFVLKEIDLGMTADVGTLQRLPHIVGDGFMREMAYTGRKVEATEAQQVGLVNHVYADKETMIKEVMQLAQTIAEKSPISIRGTKEVLLYTRDHSVNDSLNYMATWNAAVLMGNDIQEAMMAQMQKRKPEFED